MDVGKGPGGGGGLFWVKKEEMTEGRKAGRARKTKPGAPLAQSLDLPLEVAEQVYFILLFIDACL